jgi:hypothetical protein
LRRYSEVSSSVSKQGTGAAIAIDGGGTAVDDDGGGGGGGGSEAGAHIRPLLSST